MCTHNIIVLNADAKANVNSNHVIKVDFLTNYANNY